MPLTLVGIDEAGYGPLLGPLCVGCAAVRVRDWNEGDPAPDLWKLLGPAVCAAPGDKRGRIAVADSKRLKLANSLKTRHPLTHLERALFAFLWAQEAERRSDGATEGEAGEGRGATARPHGHAAEPCRDTADARAHAAGPATDPRGRCSDEDLFRALGVDLGRPPWYNGGPTRLPLAHSPGELAVAANLLRTAGAGAGVESVGLWCRAVCEDDFNETIRRAGSKAEATAGAIGHHLRRVWRSWVPRHSVADGLPRHSVADPVGPVLNRPSPRAWGGQGGAPPPTVGAGGEHEANGSTPEHLPATPDPGPPDSIRIICDRLGGRTRYADLLARLVPGARVQVLEESDRCSRYELSDGGGAGAAVRGGATFRPHGHAAEPCGARSSDARGTDRAEPRSVARPASNAGGTDFAEPKSVARAGAEPAHYLPDPSLQTPASSLQPQVSSPQPAPRFLVTFLPEAESAHLPVALASIVAKYTRELAMLRFNRYWCGRVPDLKPTAGYRQDAARWLADAAAAITDAERTGMVRIA